MRRPRPAWIYLLGLLPLGLAYEPLRALMGNPVFFLAAVAWLLLVRQVAMRVGRTRSG